MLLEERERRREAARPPVPEPRSRDPAAEVQRMRELFAGFPPPPQYVPPAPVRAAPPPYYANNRVDNAMDMQWMMIPGAYGLVCCYGFVGWFPSRGVAQMCSAHT